MHNALKTLKQCLRTLRQYPVFGVPIAGVWLIYALLLIVFKFIFPWELFNGKATLLITVLILLLKSSVLTIACLIMLEIMQQIESGQEINLVQAIKDACGRSLIYALPIIFLWTVLWLAMILLQPLLSLTQRIKGGATIESIADPLARLGLTTSLISFLEKGLRMVVFLILPAIAWENQWPWPAAKRGVQAISLHLAPFAAAFVLSDLVTYVVLAPVVVLFSLKDWVGLHLNDGIWFLLLIYMALGWSFALFVEQWMAAELYLWHLKWQKACQQATLNQQPTPQLKQVMPPGILDNVPELLGLAKLSVQQ